MGDFEDFAKKNYSLAGAAEGTQAGRPVHAGKPLNSLTASIPLSSFTRHGLVAGSTGTGKSRAVQKIIEELSAAGIPTFLTDVKGDVSGFCVEGVPERAEKRARALGYEWSPAEFPSAYWSLSNRFVPLRFRVGDVGAVLLSRLLALNPVQESHLNIAFIYAEQNAKDLVSLADLKAELEFLRENPDEVSGTSPQAINVILRKLSELAAGPAGKMFGEPAIDLKDVMADARVNVLHLADAKDDNASAVAAAFLLYKLFRDLPEIGEAARPKMVFFIDEAHVLFKDANKSVVDLVTTILRRIRSKGVGIFFITQDALDLPSPILKLLGTKIQFAMRAFTKKELDDQKAVADSFPKSDFYDVREEVKALPTGESFISILSAGGESLAPLRVAWFPPQSLMDAPDEKALEAAVDRSGLRGRYAAVQKQFKLAEFGARKPQEQKAKEAREAVGGVSVKGRAEKAMAPKGRGSAAGKNILRTLWVILKSVETFLYFVAYKPLKWFARWLLKKPKRIAWLVFFVLLVIVALRYWLEISTVIKTVFGLLDKLAGR